MVKVRLSIIVPTIGRDSLVNTLQSIKVQLGKYDEVFVVQDEGQPYYLNDDLLSEYKNDARFNFVSHTHYVDGKPVNTWGHAQRNYAMGLATGTHIASIDDDDVYTPNAFIYFRRNACEFPLIFRMRYGNLWTLWKYEGLVECGNFGTPCLLVPNTDKDAPRWALHYAGDADFAMNAVERFGAAIFRPEVVAQLRPEEFLS
jgi:glycosyltransferase involved in cell wall biosynthesis